MLGAALRSKQSYAAVSEDLGKIGWKTDLKQQGLEGADQQPSGKKPAVCPAGQGG